MYGGRGEGKKAKKPQVHLLCGLEGSWEKAKSKSIQYGAFIAQQFLDSAYFSLPLFVAKSHSFKPEDRVVDYI